MPEIHLFNPMRNACGGSEQRTLTLFEILSEHELTTIWSNETVDPEFFGKLPVKPLIWPSSYPKKGTFVFVGTYQFPGPWMEHAKPSRIILIQNLSNPERLRKFREALLEIGYPEPEILYAAPKIQMETPELPGSVQESPIDLNRFQPRSVPHEGFVVGRHSRDVTEKHHPNDPDLYRELAKRGFTVRIMGGTCLADKLGDTPGIELLPTGAVAAEEFLNGLDAFVYRTDAAWVETFGRVTFEALASGVPLLAEREQPFADFLTDGVGCYMIGADNDEIVAKLEELRANFELREQFSIEARQFIEQKMGPEWTARLSDFYLRENS